MNISNVIVSKDQNIEEQNTRYTCAVLLSSYNGSQYITKQIDSILAQKNVNIHLFVRDDGSNDETISILKEYSQNFKNVIVKFDENKGIHKSFADLMNNVLDNYDFYAFSDQDDYWDIDKISSAISCLEKFNAEFYSSASRLTDSNLNNLNRDTSDPKNYRFYMNSKHKIFTPGAQGCTMVMTKKLFEFVKKIGIIEDLGHDTWIPLLAYYFFPCVYDSRPHMCYRQHSQSWTGDRKNRLSYAGKTIKHFKNGLKRYGYISNLLLEKCGDMLTIKQKKYLEGLLPDKNFFKRVKYLFLANYRKRKFLPSIMIRFYYLLGKMK